MVQASLESDTKAFRKPSIPNHGESKFSLLYSGYLKKYRLFLSADCTELHICDSQIHEFTNEQKEKSYRNPSTVFSGTCGECPASWAQHACGQSPGLRSQSWSSLHCGAGSRSVSGKNGKTMCPKLRHQEWEDCPRDGKEETSSLPRCRTCTEVHRVEDMTVKQEKL